jgi:hypothetical protein
MPSMAIKTFFVRLMNTRNNYMKKIIVIILLFYNYSCASSIIQKNNGKLAGKGLVTIEIYKNSIIKFYKNALDTDTYKQIKIVQDQKIKELNVDNPSVFEWFLPEQFAPEINNVTFVFTDTLNGRISVISNSSKSEELWIDKSSNTRILTWEEYLVGAFSVSRNDTVINKLHSNPSDGSSVIFYNQIDCFKVKQMKNNWIEIYTPDFCESLSNNKAKVSSAWIRWRRDGRIIITYFSKS